MKKKIHIEGMSCSHCVGTITRALSAMDGVGDVEVDLDAGRAMVTLEGEVTDEEFKKEIESSGYKVAGLESVS